MIERNEYPADALMNTLDVPAQPSTRRQLLAEAEVTGLISATLGVATGAALQQGERGLAIGAGLAALGFGVVTARKLMGYGR